MNRETLLKCFEFPAREHPEPAGRVDPDQQPGAAGGVHRAVQPAPADRAAAGHPGAEQRGLQPDLQLLPEQPAAQPPHPRHAGAQPEGIQRAVRQASALHCSVHVLLLYSVVVDFVLLIGEPRIVAPGLDCPRATGHLEYNFPNIQRQS